jgi:hypothetical protein
VMALITPYAACVLGATLHVSPVMAVIVAGLATAPGRLTGLGDELRLDPLYALGQGSVAEQRHSTGIPTAPRGTHRAQMNA